MKKNFVDAGFSRFLFAFVDDAFYQASESFYTFDKTWTVLQRFFLSQSLNISYKQRLAYDNHNA